MKNVTAGKEITRMDIDQIYGPCNNTVKTGYLVNRLASVYMDISTKHIMPQVSEMSRYLAISQQETSAEKRINANAKKMEEDLQSHIRQERESFRDLANN